MVKDDESLERELPQEDAQSVASVPKCGKLAQIYRLPEFYTLLIGVGSLIALFSFYGVMLHLGQTEKANHIWKIIGYHIVGGAAVGTIKGAAFADLRNYEIIVINSLLTIAIIFLFTTAFNLSCRGLLHMPWLKNSFANLKTGARSQKKTWAKFGIPGIFAFVLFPMTGTGPIIGTLLGRLIGLGFWTNLATVTSASITTIVIATFIGDFLSKCLGDKALSWIVLSIILLVIIGAGVTHLVSWLRNRRLCRYTSDVAETPQDATNDMEFVDSPSQK